MRLRSTSSIVDAVAADHLRPTLICDYESDAVQAVLQQIDDGADGAEYLRSAHSWLSTHVAPIYTLDELQPTSTTLLKAMGSCSQRFACLESLARARGIPTRVRGLWIAGRFWGPRFRLTRPFIPRRILLAWPEFHVDGAWFGTESLFAPLKALAHSASSGFRNDAESLFDAVAHVAIDFHGRTADCAGGQCDLSAYLLDETGLFPTRDQLFRAYPLLQHTLRGRAFELIFGGRKSV